MRFHNNDSVAKYRKIEGGPYGDFTKISKKKQKENFEHSHSAEKSERRDPLEFFIFRSVAKYQKNEGRIL